MRSSGAFGVRLDVINMSDRCLAVRSAANLVAGENELAKRAIEGPTPRVDALYGAGARVGEKPVDGGGLLSGAAQCKFASDQSGNDTAGNLPRRGTCADQGICGNHKTDLQGNLINFAVASDSLEQGIGHDLNSASAMICPRDRASADPRSRAIRSSAA